MHGTVIFAMAQLSCLVVYLQEAAMAVSLVPVDDVDKKVDEVWELVYEVRPELMCDWILCFSDNICDDGKLKCKEEIKTSFINTEYQADPRKNFLWRLMNGDPSLHCFRYFSVGCVCVCAYLIFIIRVV